MSDPLDRALLGDSLEPSSGFSARVLGAVSALAAEPPPLPFPWGRLSLGIAACAALAAAATVLADGALSIGMTAATSFAASPSAATALQIGAAAVGIVLSLAAARLPRLLVRS